MKKINALLVVLIALGVLLGLGLNIRKQVAVDRSRLPSKVELSRGFQRWITNLKNKNVDVSADSFKLTNDSEIFNSKWTSVTASDTPGAQDAYKARMASHTNLDKVILSPSERIYADYRNMARDGYDQGTVIYYGLRDNKIIDSRVASCQDVPCYFDRAYFLDNDVFVVSQFSPANNQAIISQLAPLNGQMIGSCDPNLPCDYKINLYLIDLLNNKRFTYSVTVKNVRLLDVYGKL